MSNVHPFQSPNQSSSFNPISPARWQGKDPPRRDWMVENAFLRGTVALVSGDGGIGKSLILQQLCSCACLGRSWLGMSVSPGRALFIGCEDDCDELWRRQWCINRSLGRDMDDVADAGLVIDARVGRDNALMVLDKRDWRMKQTQLFVEIFNWCLGHGISYVVLDTATQMFAGNQNDERQVVDFVNGMRRLALSINGLVILTKHPSNQGRALGTGESGTVAWNNAVRSRWYLNRHLAHGLVFETKKSNYGPNDQRISLKWDRGVFVAIDPVTREPV